MSEPLTTPDLGGPPTSVNAPSGRNSEKTGLQKIMSGSVGRNLGLVLALLLARGRGRRHRR